MKVEIHLYSQSNPIPYDNVRNTYTKDGLFCIMRNDLVVDKFPTENIFRIREIPEVNVQDKKVEPLNQCLK